MSDAILVLEDGRTFTGRAYGATGRTVGEIVFNTGMTGYQETLTDPSYHRQVVVMTAPHIGNTGVNDEDPESRRIWVAGYVVRDPARRPSSWRSRRSLDEELAAQGVGELDGLDLAAEGARERVVDDALDAVLELVEEPHVHLPPRRARTGRPVQRAPWPGGREATTVRVDGIRAGRRTGARAAGRLVALPRVGATHRATGRICAQLRARSVPP